MKGRFGIAVSGGPAPGINSVISAVTIEAINQGYEVIGFQEGLKGACTGDESHVESLSIDKVSRIYNTGGSVLGTSRYSPFHVEGDVERFQQVLERHKISKLIMIGGEGSAYVSHQIAERIPGVQIAHVPKTIDNDLPLPHNLPSFGFETARSVGTTIVDTLMADAKTCGRWFLGITMGRQAGFLALGLGLASGATLTLIPEEFADRLYSPQEVAQRILSSIQHRLSLGKRYGVALLAEGILDCLDPDTSEIIRDCPRDELGRITYSEIELDDVLLGALQGLCKQHEIDVTVRTKRIGYELRCASPVSFDIEYTKFLGYGAVKYLLQGKSDFMVIRENDDLGCLPLGDLVQDGIVRSRTIDLSSHLYEVACRYMVR